jgi:hypothetical protein
VRHGLSTAFKMIPTRPATTMITGSWSFLYFTSRPTMITAIRTVEVSSSARRPSTNAAPAMAPVAAAVTPSTNALMLGLCENRLKYGAGTTVNR